MEKYEAPVVTIGAFAAEDTVVCGGCMSSTSC